jgi:hypothetical protein
MARKPIRLKTKKSPLTDEQRRWLYSVDEGLPDDVVILSFEREAATLWKSYRHEVMEWWIEQKPCSRPARFWEFELSEPRKRLGGTGEPDVSTDYKKGIPSDWEAIDPEDPPTFESEAAYLERHGLLTKSEKQWLAEHPEALEPEVISVELDEN